MMHPSRREGVVALLTTIIIALFLFSIGILLGTQTNTSIFAGQFANQADKAEALAQTGVQDALIKLGRNASTSEVYTLVETDGTIAVSIATGTPAIVNATGTVTRGKETVQRGIQAQVTINADGQITNVAQTDQ